MNCRLTRVLPFAIPLAGLLILFLIGKTSYEDRRDDTHFIAISPTSAPAADVCAVTFQRFPSVDIERLPPVESLLGDDRVALELNQYGTDEGSELVSTAETGGRLEVALSNGPLLDEPRVELVELGTSTPDFISELTPNAEVQVMPDVAATTDTPLSTGPVPTLAEHTFNDADGHVDSDGIPTSEEFIQGPATPIVDLGQTVPSNNTAVAGGDFSSPAESPRVPTLAPEFVTVSPPDATDEFGVAAREFPTPESDFAASVTPHDVVTPEKYDDSWSPIDLRDVKVTADATPHRPVSGNQASHAGRQQGEAAVRLGFELVQRGAPYSARSRFIEALRTIARSLDDVNETTSHTNALRRALAAYQEAGDFFPKSNRPDQDVNIAFVVGGHATDILQHADVGSLTPSQCVREYVAYAEQEFTKALAKEEIGSRALYGLGRLEWATATTTSSSPQVRTHRAMSLYQAAIVINPANFAAANELGVLLARHGKVDEAIVALNHSVMHSHQPTAWKNLASLYRKVGQHDQAQRAENEAAQASRRPVEMPYAVANPRVEWVEPNRFSSVSMGNGELQVAQLPANQPATVSTPPADVKQSTRRPWPFGRSKSR